VLDAPDLPDHLRLDRELGRGGMAVVYLAHDLRHDRKVALKVLHRELAAALGPGRFQREIQLTARLDHPNVLPVLDSGMFSDRLWYSMPHVDGGSLRTRLRREAQLGIPEAIRITIAVAGALEHAHQHGVVHRDIKPENILLSGDRVLVADFGIAKLLDADEAAKLTETGLSLGTPAYMSPEQAASDSRLDGRADIYALGCVLYEMLVGQPPFTGPTAQSILARHAMDPVPSVCTVRNTVPPALEAAIAKALAKVPADRFATVGEFADALVAEPARDLTLPLASRPAGARSTRRLTLRIAAPFLVIAAGAAGWLLSRPDGPRIARAASAMAVLPFAAASEDTALTRLGRDLAATVSANLDGVGDIRMVDRLTILAQTEKHSGPLALRDAAALGRRYGATSVVAGSLARDGAKVRLDVGLFSSDSLVPLARAVVTGSPDSLSALTDSVTWRVLDAVWRRGTAPTPTLEAITTRSVEALRAYLDGEQASVAGRIVEAKAAYGRAIAADSSFWFAYFRSVNAAGWTESDVDPAIKKAYWNHRALLPRRERLLIEATDLDSGLVWQRDRLEALVHEYPDYWPAWFLLGDGYVHTYPYIGSTRADARRSLERAVALNPRLTYAWAHLAWMYQMDRDTASFAHSLDVLDRLGAREIFLQGEGVDVILLFRTVLALQTGGRAARPLLDSLYRTALASIARVGELPFDYVVGLGAASPEAQIDFNRRLLRRDLPPATADLLLRFTALSWAARGAWDSALVTIERTTGSDLDPPGLWSYRLAVMGAWLEGIPNARAAELRPSAAARVAMRTPALKSELAWLDGILAAARQDLVGLASARAALGEAGDTATARAGVVDLAPFELALRGNRAAAGERLATAEIESASRDPWAPFRSHPLRRAINRMAAAPWLLAAGDTARAVGLLTWHQAVSGPFGEKIPVAPLAYLELARIEEARGQFTQARRDYRQFLVRYDMPPAGHRHLVGEASAALARLSGAPDTSEAE
jgi:serine/threonine-protein kinase